MDNPIVALLGGYSRSGKTSILQEAVYRDYPVTSTSKYLDLICSSILSEKCNYLHWQELYHLLLAREIPTTDKYVHYLQQKQDSKISFLTGGMSCREFKIFVAEKIIVPTSGRLNGLVKPALATFDMSQPLSFFETIGGEEFQMAQREILKTAAVVRINMWSEGQLENVDIRELLPQAYQIDFDPYKWYYSGVSIEERYKNTIFDEIEYFADVERREATLHKNPDIPARVARSVKVGK